VVPFRKRTLRPLLVALGLSLAVAAVPTVASASIGLGTVVSANPANFTPNVASGVVSTTFAPSVNGEVWALASDGSSLWIGGTFTSVNGTARRGVAKLNPATGANTGYLNLSISGSVTANAGPVEVYRFAVNPAGTRLVAVGNFTSVGGQTRYRAFMLTLGATSGTVNAWYYPPLQNLCRAGSLPDYLRDVDLSPDGSWFAFVSTGFIPQPGGVGRDLCDATARFVGAINPSTGLALAWNPTKERGVGGKDLYVTSQGLRVGGDTNRIGGETRRRIALLPVP
jgi:hypothetical protein